MNQPSAEFNADHATLRPRAFAMAKSTMNYKDAPAAEDVEAWRKIAADDAFGDYRDNDALTAYDGCRGLDKSLEEALSRRLFEQSQRRLAKYLNNRRYGRQSDLWKTLMQDIQEAILMPQSVPGVQIRKSFVRFIDWSTLNLIRKDLGATDGQEVFNERDHDVHPWQAIDADIDRRRAIVRFAAGNKKKLDVLLMHAMGYSQVEIAAQKIASDTMQRRWLRAFVIFLAELGIDQA